MQTPVRARTEVFLDLVPITITCSGSTSSRGPPLFCSSCETLTAVRGCERQVNNALDAVNKALNRTLAPGLNPKPNAIRSWTRKFVVRWNIPLAALCALCHAPAPCTKLH